MIWLILIVACLLLVACCYGSSLSARMVHLAMAVGALLIVPSLAQACGGVGFHFGGGYGGGCGCPAPAVSFAAPAYYSSYAVADPCLAATSYTPSFVFADPGYYGGFNTFGYNNFNVGYHRNFFNGFHSNYGFNNGVVVEEARFHRHHPAVSVSAGSNVNVHVGPFGGVHVHAH